jgi:iron-sulfur cluster insertion protein
MITLTKTAAEKVLEIAKNEGLEGQYLRLKVMGGGCAGFTYDLYFEDATPGEMDETLEQHGVKLCVDALSLQYVEGVEIDYVDKGIYGSGFKFNNPNVKSTCGCGSSFSA